MNRRFDVNLFDCFRIKMMATALVFCLAAMFAPTSAIADGLVVDLIAGQNIDAGDVYVEVIDFGDTEELCITYTTQGGWELDEYHLWVGTDIANMPQNKKGSPKLGNFPYKETRLSGGQNPVTTVSVCITFDDADSDLCNLSNLLIVAHAVVVIDTDGDGIPDSSQTGWGEGFDLGGNSWAMGLNVPLCTEEFFDADGLEDNLAAAAAGGTDGIVGLQVSHQGGNSSQPYFRGQLDYDEDGTSEQTGLPFYCVDLAHSIGGSWYCALMLSSYSDSLPSEILNPQNLDLANYVLNNYSIGDNINGVNVTGGDIQRTLWKLVYGTRVNPGAHSSGSSSDANVDSILADAAANGEGFTPPCDGVVAVILYPIGCDLAGIAGQVLIGQVLVTEFPAACGSVCTVCTE